MLFKIDYTRRQFKDISIGSKWVNNAADQTEAIKRFMDWFFRSHPGDAVRVESCMELQFVGDMGGIDLIDEAVSGER